jgi:carbon storage regulator
MLVLTRKLNEEIVVGNHIRITVIGIHPGRVRLGITAPEDVAVRRTELPDRGRAGPACRPVRRPRLGQRPGGL